MASTTSTDSQSIRLAVLRYPLGVWAVMAGVAVSNGIFRELVLIPQVGDYPGHVISTLLLVAAIVIIAYVYFSHSSVDYRQAELALVGVGWTVLTVGFEFLVGYAEGTPASETVAQYNVLAGQVWILVPLTLLVTPFLLGRRLAE